MDATRVLLVLSILVSVANGSSKCESYKHKRKIYVSNTSQYDRALRGARAGDLIIMKDGKYQNVIRGGSYREIGFINKKGNKYNPITLCGSSKAVIDAKNGYHVGLRIFKSKYINVVGITVKRASKGIRLEGAERCEIDGVTVTSIGSEGIHIQYGSHYNTVKNCKITNTGRVNKGVGEGVYLGSSSRNRRNDKCVGNKILYNMIGPGVTAEPIDVKENTRNGKIIGNVVNGKNLCGCQHAVSLINVKGNGYRIEGNIGYYARQDFFKTSQTIRGEGRNNVFTGNICKTRVSGSHQCVKVGGNNRGNKQI